MSSLRQPIPVKCNYCMHRVLPNHMQHHIAMWHRDQYTETLMVQQEPLESRQEYLSSTQEPTLELGADVNLDELGLHVNEPVQLNQHGENENGEPLFSVTPQRSIVEDISSSMVPYEPYNVRNNSPGNSSTDAPAMDPDHTQRRPESFDTSDGLSDEASPERHSQTGANFVSGYLKKHVPAMLTELNTPLRSPQILPPLSLVRSTGPEDVPSSPRGSVSSMPRLKLSPKVIPLGKGHLIPSRHAHSPGQSHAETQTKLNFEKIHEGDDDLLRCKCCHHTCHGCKAPLPTTNTGSKKPAAWRRTRLCNDVYNYCAKCAKDRKRRIQCRHCAKWLTLFSQYYKSAKPKVTQILPYHYCLNYCHDCDLRCKTPQALALHNRSEKHKEKLSKMQTVL